MDLNQNLYDLTEEKSIFSKNINNLRIKEAIECQMIAPYLPQQNGVAQRKKSYFSENGQVYALWCWHAKSILEEVINKTNTKQANQQKTHRTADGMENNCI